ncbi:DNA mismatch repair protein MutS [Candidatus Gracilibacteria bacterium 28_42_T64]|nr:DNA mismatch repair protein MutS [Candidatus Gracilibacteria bacterium 28_42_T64]
MITSRFVDQIENIIHLIDKTLKEDADNTITGGNIIADGFDTQVDQYRKIIATSNQWLAGYQADLVKQYSLSTLKIKFTGASGYFIEIPKSQLSKVPDIFTHKQSLVNASRFVTQELKEFEYKLLESESSLAQREYELFLELRAEILNDFKTVKQAGNNISNIDFVSNLAYVAYENSYIKPELISGDNLEIIGGRHIVVEQMEKDFISNDLNLTSKDFVHIITGPNMGGKSTFLRQNALIVLLAHIGSFVPAEKAKIPLTDRIFSRVGASDNLFLGQSTFMVEMQEVANILHNSTSKSFVIIDEVGRGTSTYDGMSLAWAILKENHDKIKARTLFATHYHELIDESKKLKGVKSFSVAVGESEENLVFLRKIIPGGIKKSFGLEVARIAGISKGVISEAKNMLRQLEQEHSKASQMSLGSMGNRVSEPEIQYIEKKSEVEEELENIDVNNLTPVEALNLLSNLKGKMVDRR